ncbi:substrate-binding periplasmic protein [Chitinimonas koreensis]|uniref:substrate-binding periplasmic protein n=1 Tax=Chitinimonas koreensis TaxID=356302 RepID=UPI0003FB35E0|nr:transporter substrate-binding domain-containing protein [Chitinimonas koreensis]QNM97561.1 transporter substrate-binding domain-containing protein [Chitinimonas koreensis]
MFARHALPFLAAAVLGASLVPALAADTVNLTTTDYPPYMSASLPQGGVIVAIATEAFKRGGYTAKVSVLPWARALDDGKEGQADGVIGIWRNKEREQWFLFSEPLGSNQIGFYKRNDKAIAYKSLADLKNYSIGTVRGYANPQAFEEAKLRTTEVVDDSTNLLKLGAGRVDLVLIDKGVARHLLDTSAAAAKGQVGWIEPAVDKLPLYVAISRKAPDHDKKLKALNQGLEAMQKDGTLAKMASQAGI